jgi:hypothetical protein
MTITELNILHRDSISHLFFDTNSREISEAFYNRFTETYLSDLKNYRAFGIEDNTGNITSMIACYTSRDEACWYLTDIKTQNSREEVRQLLDSVIAYNEGSGRLKFYTLCDAEDIDSVDIIFNKRYEHVDECLVPAKTRCVYNNYWQILYGRLLPAKDTVVRCFILKQKYRKILPVGGNL